MDSVEFGGESRSKMARNWGSTDGFAEAQLRELGWREAASGSVAPRNVGRDFLSPASPDPPHDLHMISTCSDCSRETPASPRLTYKTRLDPGVESSAHPETSSSSETSLLHRFIDLPYREMDEKKSLQVADLHVEDSHEAGKVNALQADDQHEHQLTVGYVMKHHKHLVWWVFYWAMCAIGW